MPTNYNEGTPRDPNITKQLNKLYRNSSAPESNTYQASRKRLESSFRAESSARPSPQISKQPFAENLHSRSTPQGYQDKAAAERQLARQRFNALQNQAKQSTLGSNSTQISAKTSAGASTIEPPGIKPRPAVPGAGVASGIATLGIGILVDRYAMPWLENKIRQASNLKPGTGFGDIAGPYYDAHLNYKLGNISEFELVQALETIRNGNPRDWGNRISQIRKLQEAAKKGKKKLGTQTESRTFTGGQSDGVLYYVGLEAGSNGQVAVTDIKQCFGPIGGARMRQTGGGGYIAEILCRGIFLGGVQNTGIPIVYDWYSIGGGGTGSADIVAFMNVTHVNRVDGQPEVVEQQTKTSIPIVPSVVRQPINFPTPRTTDKPPEENKAKPSILIIPSGFPISVSGGNGSTTITPPTTKPSQIEIPHPRTIPPDPNEEKKVPPLTISNPNSPNIKLETSGSGPVTINIPGYNPITVNPGTNKPQGALPIQDVQRQYQPVASTATPTKPGTTPTAPTSPTTTKPATTEDLDQFKKDLEKLILTGGLLAGLTPAIQAIGDRVNQTARQTTPEALETAAAAGTCRTTQPGGCTTKALDDAVGQVNQNSDNKFKGLQDSLNTTLNGFNAALIEQTWRNTLTINNKLGAQIPGGGISSFMQRTWQVLQVDRILNVLTFVNTTHNAYMLSNALSQTLFSMVSNVLAAVGIKDAEANPLNVGSIIGKSIESFFKSVIGSETVDGIQTKFKNANRIYQATANLYSSFQSIGYSILSAAGVIADRVGIVGNALRFWGVVSEKAYKWMNPQTNFQNRFFTAIDTTQNAISSIDAVASEVLNVQQIVDQIKIQNKELQDSLQQTKGSKQGESEPEAEKIKIEAERSKAASASTATVASLNKPDS